MRKVVLSRASRTTAPDDPCSFFLQRNEMLTPSTIVVLTLSALLPGVVHARANGAPLAACVRIFPEGHFTASQPLDDSPFSLNVSSFGGDYTPGEAYQCKNAVSPHSTV